MTNGSFHFPKTLAEQWRAPPPGRAMSESWWPSSCSPAWWSALRDREPEEEEQCLGEAGIMGAGEGWMARNGEVRDARNWRGNRERNVYKKGTLKTAAREGQTIPKSKQQAIPKAKPFGWKLTNFEQFWNLIYVSTRFAPLCLPILLLLCGFFFWREKLAELGVHPPTLYRKYPRSRNH